MVSELVRKELRFLAPWYLALSGLIWLISLLARGFDWAMPLGLLLGCVTSAGYFILMGQGLEEAVRRFRNPALEKKRKMFVLGRYLLRYGGVAVVLAVSFLPGVRGVWLDPLGVLLPLLYPKAAYLLNAAFFKKGKR